MAESIIKEEIHPVQGKKRIIEMDIIRGFALFGVLLVNLTMMGDISLVTRLDAMVASAIVFLAEGKFYTIFSFLFGLGFYFFMNKTDNTFDLVYQKRFKRRLFCLLFFGFLHFIFVWHGDILHTYAIVGFLLLRKSNRSTGSLKKNIIILFIVSTFLFAIFMSFSPMDMMKEKKTLNEILSSGSFIEVTMFRLTKLLPQALSGLILLFPKILALFYVGYSLGQKRIFHNLDQHEASIKKLFFISGILFLLSLCGMVLTNHYTMTHGFKRLYGFIYGLSYELSTFAGSSFYVLSLLILMKKAAVLKALSPLKYMGQMALTNYLMQTIFWSFVFHGYGLGCYSRMPMAWIPVLALLFFSIQILLSRLWLKKHRFGPMEKLWRTLTYGKL